MDVDIAIIGGGPAGLAAAVEAKKQGVKKVLILERDMELGGILQQCIHDGFGVHRFNKRLSGNQYAQAFIDMTLESDIDIKLDTMVLEVTPDKEIFACNDVDGMIHIKCGAIILAMGCRERTASQVFIHGDRPTGVMTAGAVQRYINMEGYLPGKKAVILGSGDIGLIMARRMVLEGMDVLGVYEVMADPGGLTRNIVQCLADFGIPLHLKTTVTKVKGKERVESVTIAKVDENIKPIAGTEEVIECDLLVLAVGLIPENELSINAGIELDPRTKGPLVDENFMTCIPGIFAAGNVTVVFDLVDYVSESGEIAARGAVQYLNGKLPKVMSYQDVEAGDNISFVVPQRMIVGGNRDTEENTVFYMRAKTPKKVTKLICDQQGETIINKTCRHVAPAEMLAVSLKLSKSEGVSFYMQEKDS